MELLHRHLRASVWREECILPFVRGGRTGTRGPPCYVKGERGKFCSVVETCGLCMLAQRLTMAELADDCSPCTTAGNTNGILLLCKTSPFGQTRRRRPDLAHPLRLGRMRRFRATSPKRNTYSVRPHAELYFISFMNQTLLRWKEETNHRQSRTGDLYRDRAAQAHSSSASDRLMLRTPLATTTPGQPVRSCPSSTAQRPRADQGKGRCWGGCTFRMPICNLLQYLNTSLRLKRRHT